MIRNQRLLLPVLALILLAGCQAIPQHNDPVAELVSAIESNLAVNRLTLPEGDNAMEKIDQLATLSPNDPRIAKYRSRVVKKLVTIGQKEFLEGDLYRAKQMAFRALEINPDSAEAGYILTAIAEASRPVQLETGTFEVETVDESGSVDIITVTVPDLDTIVSE
ncbi:hypothetical protein M3P05_00760 [Sansalvadorimonas sp. 2012CJ34-2]|uniref:Tetratricopeptide repeat protein n=1 Tax=Parendozoicomonas callyspongiae TaxID=2942213 RepID=A0ABT0PBR9_9GAMM|nr:hypothetical protein [Sansalvadorimonas sp. 2012CJ34-2]MCL6268481.1 hypothetical protein [Sansalvadorimonas sp. 2012CJ34-2]